MIICSISILFVPFHYVPLLVHASYKKNRGNALMNMAGSARMRADSPAYQLARAAKRRLRAASLVQRGGVAPGRVGVG